MQQKRLTQAERCKISFLLEEEKSTTEIANRLERDKSVIHREIKRNSCNGIYCPEKAGILAVHYSNIQTLNQNSVIGLSQICLVLKEIL